MKKFLFLISVIIISLIIVFKHYGSNINNDIVTFSSWGSQSETVILNDIIKDFELKNPDIKIKFMHIPQNYFQKIQLLFASGLQPDIVFFNNQNIQMYIKANLLEDLSSIINKDDYFVQSVNCFSDNGKIYAIPRDISSLVIFYNKDIIKNPKKLNNIFELKDLAVKYTNKNHFGINFEEDSLYWLYFLASNGGGIISDDKTKIIINEKESIEALNLYSDLVNKYHAAPSKAQIGSMTTAQMFINGKLAMYMGGRWMIPKFRETINFDWDIMEFPSSNNNKVYIDASGWAISKASKNKEKAYKFLKYISSHDSINKLAKTGLIIPANKVCAKECILKDINNKPKHSDIFINLIQNTKPSPVNENYGVINDIIKDKAQSIFIGGKNPSEVFDAKTVKMLESKL